MEVSVFPNAARPGVGRAPARENRRAFLPQHARMMPVVEEANKLGFLVYPPLHDDESMQLQLTGEDVLVVTFWKGDDVGQRGTAFVAEYTRSAGSGGIGDSKVAIVNDHVGYDEAGARALLGAVLQGVNTPPGTVGVRGTHDFATPEGWDTVYTAVLNDLQRPAVGVLALRVETDWLPHTTEFRYALETGDTLSLVGSGPIGQVFFVPREGVELRDASSTELKRFARLKREVDAEIARSLRRTRYGGAFSYEYDQRRREQVDGRGLLPRSTSGRARRTGERSG